MVLGIYKHTGCKGWFLYGYCYSSIYAVPVFQVVGNTLRPRGNGRHFSNDIFITISLNSIQILSVKLVLEASICKQSVFIQMMIMVVACSSPTNSDIY